MSKKIISQLLLSIDLEDVRDHVDKGSEYREAVPDNTRKYLEYLQSRKAKATFFVVGNVARKYPSLITEITSEGHEIACHSDGHIQLDKQTEKEFTEDINRNIESLYSAGATEIIGYRAPTFSLTESTKWVYAKLLQAGIKYSSSVLPASNPLYGWKEFGQKPKYVEGILEIPMTLHAIPYLNVPLAGGVYFRVLPSILINYSVRQHIKKGNPVTTYFHPYDIDTRQERFMHPDLGNKRILNYLMYINRSKVFSKLDRLTDLCQPVSYKEYFLSLCDDEQSHVAVKGKY